MRKLTVMTFNLLYAGAVNPAGSWAERLPLVRDVLEGSGADVVALQEATAAQLHDLERVLSGFAIVPGPESGETRLPRVVQTATSLLRRRPRKPPAHAREHPHPPHPIPHRHAPAAQHPAHHGPHGPHAPQYAPHLPHTAHGYRRGEHCAILYRPDRFEVERANAFWLSHSPDVSGSVLPGSWLPRVVNWVRLRARGEAAGDDAAAPTPGPAFTVYNAHLDFLPWSPPRSARILRRVLDAQWDATPQILMGDFNAAPNSAAYRHLAREIERGYHPALVDAYHAAAERVGPEGTFHGGTGRVRWIGRLDRILLRPDLPVARVTTITHREGERYPSDHYPVKAELTLTG